MTLRGTWRGTALLGLWLAVAACGGSKSEQTATWRADCPSLARPEPLSLGAARDARAHGGTPARAPDAGGGGARLVPA